MFDRTFLSKFFLFLRKIGLYKNVGVTKIKGKLGFPKAQHNKEQIKKALKSQGVDIKFLDEE